MGYLRVSRSLAEGERGGLCKHLGIFARSSREWRTRGDVRRCRRRRSRAKHGECLRRISGGGSGRRCRRGRRRRGQGVAPEDLGELTSVLGLRRGPGRRQRRNVPRSTLWRHRGVEKACKFARLRTLARRSAGGGGALRLEHLRELTGLRRGWCRYQGRRLRNRALRRLEHSGEFARRWRGPLRHRGLRLGNRKQAGELAGLLRGGSWRRRCGSLDGRSELARDLARIRRRDSRRLDRRRQFQGMLPGVRQW